MFFDSWMGLGRVAVVGVLAYATLVFLLRVSGKRTLSKLNAFDLVITVALGSTLATILLSKDVALIEGVLAFGVLIFLQFIITWTSVRSARVQCLIKAQPTMLYFRGKFIERAMHWERVTPAEVQAAVRQQGIADLSTIEAIVLETDGTIAIITARAANASDSSLSNVKHCPLAPDTGEPFPHLR